MWFDKYLQELLQKNLDLFPKVADHPHPFANLTQKWAAETKSAK